MREALQRTQEFLELFSASRRSRQIALDRIKRGAGRLYGGALFRASRGAQNVCATGLLRVRGAQGMSLGEHVLFLGGMVPTEIVCENGARLEVGDESGFNYGVSIRATQSIRIGKRCMFASFVRVCDVGPTRTAPVIIDDDVWIAHGAIIEAGVHIGEGSVVSAGSVVTRDVPPRSLAIGNPARCMPLEVVARESRTAES
jgi:maltose O-acetyltransferase